MDHSITTRPPAPHKEALACAPLSERLMRSSLHKVMSRCHVSFPSWSEITGLTLLNKQNLTEQIPCMIIYVYDVAEFISAMTWEEMRTWDRGCCDSQRNTWSVKPFFTNSRHRGRWTASVKAKDKLCPDILDTSVNVKGLLGALPSLWVPSFCTQFPERTVACCIRTTPALSHRGQSSQSHLASPLRASFRSVILPIIGGVPYFEAHCNIMNGNLKEKESTGTTIY